uniref:Uncharacterized protein n=1 Tax=viral metagenome TaxID=1070528 RepID=A0A6C0JL76_9ZZZZ
MIIELPISLGEAIDKLTILDIKYNKIVDNRKNDVKKEYELLYDILKNFIIKYETLYQTMKKVNLLIWDMMDSLRDGNLNEEMYLQICKECIEYNDIRFRVKNKINYVSNSVLKEQKSYKINRLIIQIEKDITDNLLLNIIKYFSFMYDEIIIMSTFNLTYLRETFNYDITIMFNECETDYKNKVIIENKEYSDDELYKLFNITYVEINNIL